MCKKNLLEIDLQKEGLHMFWETKMGQILSPKKLITKKFLALQKTKTSILTCGLSTNFC